MFIYQVLNNDYSRVQLYLFWVDFNLECVKWYSSCTNGHKMLKIPVLMRSPLPTVGEDLLGTPGDIGILQPADVKAPFILCDKCQKLFLWFSLSKAIYNHQLYIYPPSHHSNQPATFSLFGLSDIRTFYHADDAFNLTVH